MKYPFYSRRSIIALFLMFLTWQLSSFSKTNSFTESSSLIQTCYQKLLGSSMRPRQSLESKVMILKNLLVSAKQCSDVPAICAASFIHSKPVNNYTRFRSIFMLECSTLTQLSLLNILRPSVEYCSNQIFLPLKFYCVFFLK